MVHFFGILSPAFGDRTAAPDAPHKADFFSGVPDAAFGAVPLTRAEQDACYLAGKGPQPAEVDDRMSGLRFTRFALPGIV